MTHMGIGFFAGALLGGAVGLFTIEAPVFGAIVGGCGPGNGVFDGMR